MTTSRGVRGLDDLFSTIGKTRAAISGVVLMVMLASGMPSLAAEDSDLAEEPRKVIEETVSQIIAILARKDESAEFRIHEIERIAYDVFDFTTMSKLVLARKWRKLSKDQKGEFVREFKRSLSRTYGTRLDRYNQEQVEIIGTQVEPRDDVSIKTRIVGGEFGGAELSYRMRKRSDRWRIIDVVIEGVSLVSNYRSQFAEILNSGTIDDLLERLRDKNFNADVIDNASKS
jgi:phospholipid transport system substrate-binding protein